MISATFMVLVGLSMPSFIGGSGRDSIDASRVVHIPGGTSDWGTIALYVLIVTVVAKPRKNAPGLHVQKGGALGRSDSPSPSACGPGVRSAQGFSSSASDTDWEVLW